MVNAQDKITSGFKALSDAILFTGDAMIENHALLVKDGKILDIAANHKIPSEAARIPYPNHILAPGFIDAQVNGGGSFLLNNSPTVDTCLAIAKAHQKFGTPRVLLTCISDTLDVTEKAISAVRKARQQDKAILGIHIEGPHLGHERRGVHEAKHLRTISDGDLKLYRREGDEIMLMTLAPECVSPDQIKQLRKEGVIVSLGHTTALEGQVHAALEAGATGFTHLYNGMGGMTGRSPGVTGIALDDPNSWCSLIADGHHVSPEMIRLAIRAKPLGKVFLISDAVAPAASDKIEPFRLYGETIRTENGRCVNKEGKLAGSSITLLDAVRYCVKTVKIELDEALRMASTYPAAFLGLDNSLGKLLPGFEATITAINAEMI